MQKLAARGPAVKLFLPRTVAFIRRYPVITACIAAQLAIGASNCWTMHRAAVLRDQALDYYRRVDKASDTMKQAYVKVKALQADSQKRYEEATQLAKKARQMMLKSCDSNNGSKAVSFTMSGE
jgi:hypothetical protein